MKAYIDINKSSYKEGLDAEVTVRLKFKTGREINVELKGSELMRALLGESELEVEVSLRNVELTLK